MQLSLVQPSTITQSVTPSVLHQLFGTGSASRVCWVSAARQAVQQEGKNRVVLHIDWTLSRQ